MHNAHRIPAAAAACLALAVALPAVADTVTLRNGDRITGDVVRKENGTLIVKTSYAGEIKIKWADVAGISTDKAVEVQLADGSNFDARLVPGADGKLALEAPARAGEPGVALDRIAFINPTPAQSGKGVAYQRRISVAANLVRGNTDSGRLQAEGEFVGRAKEYRYRLWAQGTNASESGDTTESNWRATGSYDWFLRPKQFVYARASFEQDEFRDLKLRSQLGVGYGYQIIETKDTELSVQVGPDAVNVISYGDTPEDTFVAAAWGVHYAQWLFTRAAQVYFDQSGFWNLQTTSDAVIHTNTGVRVPVAGGLTATTALKVDWDSDPAPGTESTDTTLLFGLGYAW